MTWRSSWGGDRAILEEIDRVLTEIADPPVGATSLVRDDDLGNDEAAGSWTLHAYSEEPLGADILSLLPEGYRDPANTEQLPEKDWVADALQGLGIVRAGPFVLFGRHDAEEAARVDGIPLQIEANRAFGTGHHPTTSGCLEAIGALRDAGPARILDIGTGSGVLALAARRMFPEARVLATDIDETSIDIARENAAINSVSGIEFGVAAGTDYPLTQEQAPFQLLFANILAGPLVELAPDIAAVADDRSTLILAGLLDEQADDVLSAYTRHGFRHVATHGTDRWPVLTLETRHSVP